MVCPSGRLGVEAAHRCGATGRLSCKRPEQLPVGKLHVLEPVELDGELLDGVEDIAHVPEGHAGWGAAGAPAASTASLKLGLWFWFCLPDREAVGLGGLSGGVGGSCWHADIKAVSFSHNFEVGS